MSSLNRDNPELNHAYKASVPTLEVLALPCGNVAVVTLAVRMVKFGTPPR